MLPKPAWKEKFETFAKVPNLANGLNVVIVEDIKADLKKHHKLEEAKLLCTEIVKDIERAGIPANNWTQTNRPYSLFYKNDHLWAHVATDGRHFILYQDEAVRTKFYLFRYFPHQDEESVREYFSFLQSWEHAYAQIQDASIQQFYKKYQVM